MLRFRLFGIPIGVHLTFGFLVFLPVLFGQRLSAAAIAAWGFAVFLAVLAHELGHALTARAFDARGVQVTLYGLGGVTTYRHGRGGMSHGKSFFVSAAGSFVGIVLGGLVWLARTNGLGEGAPPEIDYFLESFVFAALWWGVLNWIPIVPLDGGHMAESLAAMIDEDRAPLIGQIVTWTAVAIVVPLALLNGYQFAAIFVVLFALSGVREYRSKQEAKRRPRADTPGQPLEATVLDEQTESAVPSERSGDRASPSSGTGMEGRRLPDRTDDPGPSATRRDDGPPEFPI